MVDGLAELANHRAWPVEEAQSLQEQVKQGLQKLPVTCMDPAGHKTHRVVQGILNKVPQ